MDNYNNEMNDKTTVEFNELSFEESLKLDSKVRHVAHCFIFTGSNSSPESMYGIMQMRSDGRIGFVGGGINAEFPTISHIVDGLNREIFEELNYESANVTKKNYFISHLVVRNDGTKMVSHFFIKKVPSMNVFRQIEKNHSDASDFPSESFGIFRVPVYSDNSYIENFTKNHFVGNVKLQLLAALNAIKNGEDRDWE